MKIPTKTMFPGARPVLLSCLLFASVASAAEVSWNFSTATPSSPAVGDLTVSALSRGNNNPDPGTNTLFNATSASSGYTGSSGTNNAGLAARTGALNTAASGSGYFEFVFTPTSGFQFSISALEFGTRSTSTGPQAYALRSSADGYATDLLTGTIANNSAWSLKSHSALAITGTGATTFRLFGYSGTGSAGTNNSNWRIDDLKLEVSVTSSGADTTPPAISALSPADDATGVSLTPTLTLTFNENVIAGSGLISLFDSANPSTAIETFDVTTEVTFSTNTATFTPTVTLTNGATYYVQLPSGAILDTASPANAFGGISDTTTWNFTTVGPDLTGPVVTALLPADDATLDGSPAELKVTFDETIAAGTGTITLYNAAGNTVVETYSVPGDVSIVGTELSVFPAVTLTPGASYYLQIPAGAVVDTAPAANGFAGILDTTTWSFSLRPVPSLTLSGPYTQDFSAFTSATNLPAVSPLLPEGWTATGVDLTYDGNWDTGTTGGFRGNASVLGYHHTGSTGVLEKKLTLLNATGAEITDLTISYTGRMALPLNGRTPSYVVSVNGTAVAGLAYSTSSGDGVVTSASVSSLSIPVGATFSITWVSDGSTTGSPGSGSRRQIGISNVSVSAGAALFPPSMGPISADYSSLTTSAVTLASDVTADGGSAITARGIVYSEFSVNPSPELLGTGVTNVPDAAPATGPTTSPITGLTAGTQYAVRAYATNAQGTSYSSVLSVFTLATPPALVTNYTQPFDNFSGSIVTGTLPAGWSVVSAGGLNGFAGNWGPSTSSGGLLGNVSTPNGVLGYQHVGASGVVTATLTLTNNTGATIDELYLGYTGRVARLDQTREPEWTVALNGTVIPELAYSTSSGVDQDKSHTVTGLTIAPGATFTLTWTSDGNVGTGGGRRQIGIADVYVGIEPPPAGGYADWATANGIVGTADDDDDNDGISNLLEYALGLTPGSSDSLANSFNGSTLSFTAGAEAVAGGDLTYTIETSPDLGASGPWTTVVTGLDVNNVISYTLPAGTRLFARLRVVQN